MLGQPTGMLVQSFFILNQGKRYFVWGPCIDPKNNYFVPFDQLALSKLLEQVQKGGCALVQGSFRVGKTSHLQELERQLHNFGYLCVRYCTCYELFKIKELLSSLEVVYGVVSQKLLMLKSVMQSH